MKLVFCLPGKSFSDRFLSAWTSTVVWCIQNQHQFLVSQAQSNNVYLVRAKCLGADVMRGKHQKPFDGKVEYSHIVFIDSDSVWQPEQIGKLLAHNKDIVAALQAWEGGAGFTCGYWDKSFFKKNGYMPYLKPEDVKDKTELMQVDYSGFGLMVIRRGVFEAMEYNWFTPLVTEWGNIRDFAMEDCSWCYRAREKGYKIWIDPTVRVGHEKTAIY